MGCGLSKEGEPGCACCSRRQDTTTRLKARAQFEMALISTIVFSVFILALPFTIPALILGYKAVNEFDNGDEEKCTNYTFRAKILNAIGAVVGANSLIIVSLFDVFAA